MKTRSNVNSRISNHVKNIEQEIIRKNEELKSFIQAGTDWNDKH